MREGWVEKKLEDLADEKKAIVSGPFGSNLKVSDYRDSGIPIIRLQNVGKGYFIEKDIKYIDKEKAEELKSHSFVVGDIVLAKLGIPIGKTCIIPDSFSDGIILADIVRIRPDRKRVDYNFLEYFLNTSLSVSQLTKNISGATRPRVNLSNVRSIVVPIPPLPEQKQIVKTLDLAFGQIDQAKANLEQNLANAKELFASKLNEVFSQRGEGWEEKKLDEICEVKDGTHSSPKYVDEENGIPFVTQKNILELGLSFVNTKFISQVDHDDYYRRSNVSYNDIIFSMIGANRGMACIVDTEKVFSIKNVGLIKSNKEYVPKYLLFYLKSDLARNYVKQNSSGSAQGFIGLTKLRKFPIPYVDIEIQKEIVKELDKLSELSNKLQTHYQQNLNNLEELKKSILEKAFKGEL